MEIAAVKLQSEMNKYTYVIQHVAEEDTPDEDVKLIGVFSSKENAQQCVANMRRKKGFRKYPNGFCIDRYTLNEIEWSEGFIE